MDYIGHGIKADVTYSGATNRVDYQVLSNGTPIFNGVCQVGNKINLTPIIDTDLRRADIKNRDVITINDRFIRTYTFNTSGGSVTLDDNVICDWSPNIRTKFRDLSDTEASILNLASNDNIEGRWTYFPKACVIPDVSSDNLYMRFSLVALTAFTEENVFVSFLDAEEQTIEKVKIGNISISQYDNVIISVPTSLFAEYIPLAKYVHIQIDEDLYSFTILHGMDSCRVKYVVSWVGRNGAIYTLPMYGNDKLNEKITKSELLSLDDTTDVFKSVVESTLNVNTGILNDKYVIALMEDLFVSRCVSIYDVERDIELFGVVDGTYESKKFEDNNELVSYSIDFKIDKTENIRYK